MRSKNIRLAYLLVTSPMPNTYIGGIMVVDDRGLPIEFRYTEPIQPTKIQQLLYGSVLSKYIKTEVIFESLLQSLESNFQLLIVNDDNFLDLHPSKKSFDVIRLTETKSGPIGGPGDWNQLSATEYLLQFTAETAPARIQLAEPDEAPPTDVPQLEHAASDTDFSQTPIYTLLTTISQTVDVTEPLLRVEKALSELCQEAGIKTHAS